MQNMSIKYRLLPWQMYMLRISVFSAKQRKKLFFHFLMFESFLKIRAKHKAPACALFFPDRPRLAVAGFQVGIFQPLQIGKGFLRGDGFEVGFGRVVLEGQAKA